MQVKLLPVVLIFITFNLTSFSQSYKISITNGIFINEYTYEFDIVIIGGGNDFELTSYQVSLNNFLENTHEVAFSYINGTSELNNPPLFAIGTLINNNGNSLLTFASLPGNDIIGNTEKRIGRFLLTSNQNLIRRRAFVFWNFEGDVQTILTGPDFSNITSLGDFYPTKGTNLNFEAAEINEYELLQNFPNPFNPTTSIKYKIPFESSVKLKIFNVLGEEVKTLVDEFLTPGVYEVRFDAESLPSGYYIYSLYANNKMIENKKMILIK